MNVLVDVEWLQESETIKTITQIAASRISDSWEVVDEFSCLVCPAEDWHCDWDHMAYNGYSPDEFRIGSTEDECMALFASYIRDEDKLCVWSNGAKKLLKEKYELYMGTTLPTKCLCVNDKVYAVAKHRGLSNFEMYAVAEAFGMDTPVPKHCSVNDNRVLLWLLKELNINLDIPQRAVPTKKIVSKTERNTDILARVQYNFIFTPESAVYHRPSCKLMLKANDIKGCVYFRNIPKDRRPCKVCRPTADDERTTHIEATKDRPIPRTKPKQPAEKEIVVARMLGNQHISITKSKLVGCCHNIIHPGKLTAKIMEEHDCIGKQCRFFEKYEDSSYWLGRENKRREKEKRKAAQRQQKQQAQKLEEELEETKELFQSYADAFEYELMIVRLQKEKENRYKVFYVSENRFADGNRFPHFLETIKYYFPKYRIELRHIRDVDGHFVTIDEYIARKR